MTKQKKEKWFRFKTSIQHKIVLCGVMLIVATVGINTYVTVKTETEVLTRKQLYQGKRAAKEIAFGLKKTLLSANKEHSTSLLQSSVINRHDDVIYTRVVKPDGRIYMADDKSYCGRMAPLSYLVKQEQILTKYFFQEQREFGTLVVRPVVIANERWYVAVGISSGPINATVKRLILHNLISGTTVILLGTLITFLLAKSICKPIIELTRAAEIVSGGNLEYIVQVNTKDEVGELARTFNNMAGKLNKSYNYLAKKVQEVAAEEELLRITLDGMSEGLIAVDAEKRIVLFNQVAENLLGYKSEQVEGKSVDEVFHLVDEQTEEALENPIDKAFNSGKTESADRNALLVPKNGDKCPVFVQAALVGKNKDALVRAIMVIHDTSSERELDRMKTDFTSSVSHELRTPLTSIKAYTATILRDPKMPEETKRQFLTIIDEESDRLASLIEDLLEVSRIDSKKTKIKWKEMDITGVIKKVMLVLQPLAKEKNIRLKANISNELPKLPADESKIESVVTNLINNAIKFTPEGGQVTVNAKLQEEQVIISVEDTGMGIPENDLQKIFERFYRVHRQGKQIQGTGLGLSIVNEIVKTHDGKIEVQSTLNKGTTFTVFLPLKATSESDVSPTKETVSV